MKKILFALLLLLPSLIFAQATGFIVSNKPTGGSIGTAPTTVDVNTLFNLNQTTAGQTLTVPNLSNASSGKIIYLNNIGSVQLTLSPGGVLPVGYGVILRWDLVRWNVCTPIQINITGNAATVTTNANLTGPVTSIGNATSIANGAISNAMLANGAVANLSGTNTGDNNFYLNDGTQTGNRLCQSAGYSTTFSGGGTFSIKRDALSVQTKNGVDFHDQSFINYTAPTVALFGNSSNSYFADSISLQSYLGIDLVTPIVNIAGAVLTNSLTATVKAAASYSLAPSDSTNWIPQTSWVKRQFLTHPSLNISNSNLTSTGTYTLNLNSNPLTIKAGQFNLISNGSNYTTISQQNTNSAGDTLFRMLSDGTFKIGLNATNIAGSVAITIGNQARTSSYGTSIGFQAGKNQSQAAGVIFNQFIGFQAGGSGIITGSENIGIGNQALYTLTSGNYNNCIGDLSGSSLTVGTGNSYFGLAAGLLNTSGNYNTAIGFGAGRGGTNSNCASLGYYAGHYETSDNTILIDVLNRTNEANSRAFAPIYIVADPTVSNQRLTINANTGIGGSATSTSILNIKGLPTSSSGLVNGDVWSNSGILTIVP